MKYRLALLLFAAGALTGCGEDPPADSVNVTAEADAADEPPLEAASEFPQLERGEAFDGVIVTYNFRILPVKYERIGEYAVIGGDMIIGEHEEMQRRWAVFTGLSTGNLDIIPAPERRAIVMLADQTGGENSPLFTGPFADLGDGAASLFTGPMAPQLVRVLGWVTLDPIWPSRVIAYEVAPTIQSNPRDPRNANIQQAVALWNAINIVQLRPTASASPAERQRGMIRFVDHMADDSLFACMSPVGFRPQNGVQKVHVNPKCLSGNIAHEIGHALGLLHEHQRTDRGAFLQVNTSVPMDTRNYAPLPGRPVGGHNLCSIMHYAANATVPNRDWFKLTAAGDVAYRSCSAAMAAGCRRVGQRCQLSPGDVGAIRALYP